MKRMHRVLLIIVLVLLAILVLFIPLKQNEVKAVTTEKEITPIAMLSMERLQAPPRKPVKTLKEEASNTPSKETSSALAPTLPVPSEEKTAMKEETSKRPEQNTSQEEPLEEKNYRRR